MVHAAVLGRYQALVYVVLVDLRFLILRLFGLAPRLLFYEVEVIHANAEPFEIGAGEFKIDLLTAVIDFGNSKDTLAFAYGDHVADSRSVVMLMVLWLRFWANALNRLLPMFTGSALFGGFRLLAISCRHTDGIQEAMTKRYRADNDDD